MFTAIALSLLFAAVTAGGGAWRYLQIMERTGAKQLFPVIIFHLVVFSAFVGEALWLLNRLYH